MGYSTTAGDRTEPTGRWSRQPLHSGSWRWGYPGPGFPAEAFLLAIREIRAGASEVLAESLLIESFRPLWNVLIDGFGNHDPGAGRYDQKRSAWDVLHPGRPWADRLQPHPRSEAELLELIGRFSAHALVAQALTDEALSPEDDGGVI